MNTVVVTLSDEAYFSKARRTIIDIRSRGEWTGEIVLICVEFNPPRNFIDFYKVTPFCVKHIDTSALLEKYKEYKECQKKLTRDNREFSKLTQWDKFYVFDEYFKKWNKVIYFDAGLRVLDKVKYLLDLDCPTGAFMAPDDGGSLTNTEFRFGNIIDTDINLEASTLLMQEYSQSTQSTQSILNSRYFLNCIWVYDTTLLMLERLQKTDKTESVFEELIRTMNKYPICKCNEMTIMNLLFTFKYKVWKRFPEYINTDTGKSKKLFGWSEVAEKIESWRGVCFMKYPTTIDFDC